LCGVTDQACITWYARGFSRYGRGFKFHTHPRFEIKIERVVGFLNQIVVIVGCIEQICEIRSCGWVPDKKRSAQ
jgi:hypothetical protein